MTNEQILKKAIEKAIRGGWKGTVTAGVEIFDDYYMFKGVKEKYDYESVAEECGDLIFDHDFAKAFWGEEETSIGFQNLHRECRYWWHYYLQQMVLEEEPLKYLEKFL